MKVILDDKVYNDIWAKIDKIIVNFDTIGVPFELDINNYKSYKLNTIWNEEEEKIVNDIFKEISKNDIYALNWQHDCFEFNPQEEIPLYYHYHDFDRNVEVYFPSYYPNGDFYFFVAKDFSYGLLGHPWRKEIYVFGNELIDKFDGKMEQLDLSKINVNFLDKFVKCIKSILLKRKKLGL